MDIQGKTTVKFGTTCCALAFLSACDDTSDAELDWQLNLMRKSAKEKWDRSNRQGGETAVQCVTVPLYEQNLERKLIARGFKVISEFNRRNGYPQTCKLKLWFLNLQD